MVDTSRYHVMWLLPEDFKGKSKVRNIYWVRSQDSEGEELDDQKLKDEDSEDEQSDDEELGEEESDDAEEIFRRIEGT